MTMNKSVFALLLTAALLSTVSCDKTKQLFPKPPSQGGDDLAEDVQLPDYIFADDIFQIFTDPASVEEDGLNTPERFFEFVLSATAARYR